MKPVKHAVAAVIHTAGPYAADRVLLVRRPLDDPELPGDWGLPAASLRGERWESAVERVGREKLGVRLESRRELREGTVERPDYLLHMKLWEAAIVDGEPEVPQAVDGMTQYIEWRWGRARDLVPAARHGSLCSRLYLRELGRGWTP